MSTQDLPKSNYIFVYNRRSERYLKNAPLQIIDENNRKLTGHNAAIIRNVGYPDMMF